MMVAGLVLLLTVVLAASGTAKLLDLRGSAATLRGFGIPERLLNPGAVGLPLAELAIAALLIPAPTSRAGAVAAAVLFSAFALAIATSLLRGRRPDCGCFGRLHSAPIGLSTLARAGGLAALAGLLAVEGGGAGGAVVAEPVAWLAALTGGQSILLVAVLRRHGRALARLDGLHPAPDRVELAAGSEAPDFTLTDLDGDAVSLVDLRSRNRPTVLVFSHPGCGACTALLPEVGRWQREHASRLTVALVSEGDRELVRADAAEHGLGLVLPQEGHEVTDAYGANGTPAAVLVDAGGRVVEPLRYGADGVRAVLGHALDHARRAGGLVAAAAAVGAAPALAAPVDDEDDAIRELARILRAHDPALRRETNRLAAATRRLFAQPQTSSVRFELLSAIALVRKELRWTKEEVDAVPVPDYRPGEKGARIGKSHAAAHLAYLSLVLDHYASAAKAKSFAAAARHFDEVRRLTVEAEKRRRLAAKKLGCTRTLEEC
jgi:peroxiredoxin